MNINEYQKLANRTANHSLRAETRRITAALGLAGESGEIADIIKKNVGQGHDLNADDIVDELGDVLWYVAELADALGTTLEEVATRNVEKLMRRYPAGFDAKTSRARYEDS